MTAATRVASELPTGDHNVRSSGFRSTGTTNVGWATARFRPCPRGKAQR